MVIPQTLVERMVTYARQEFPNEACGLLATNDSAVVQFYPTRNVDESPVHFTLDSQDQLQAMTSMDECGWELGAIYHSHTRTPARPSETDIRMANVSRRFLGDVPWVIVSLAYPDTPSIRAWHIEDDEVREESVETA